MSRSSSFKASIAPTLAASSPTEKCVIPGTFPFFTNCAIFKSMRRISSILRNISNKRLLSNVAIISPFLAFIHSLSFYPKLKALSKKMLNYLHKSNSIEHWCNRVFQLLYKRFTKSYIEKILILRNKKTDRKRPIGSLLFSSLTKVTNHLFQFLTTWSC